MEMTPDDGSEDQEVKEEVDVVTGRRKCWRERRTSRELWWLNCAQLAECFAG